MARPHKPLISVEGLVTAALDLIDEAGDFSLPKLARRISVSQSSIYHHVSGREEILELVRGRLLSESPYSVPAGAGWEEALRQMIRSYRGSFARHPRAAPLMVMQTVQNAQAIALYEELAEALEDAGFEGADVASAIAVIDSFALGSALDLAAPGDVWEASGVSSPALGRAVTGAAELEDRADTAFEFGLQVLLDGLRMRLSHSGAGIHS